MTAADEASVIENAETCGAEIFTALTSRDSGRANDVADLAYAYHLALALMMRDTSVTDREAIAMHRVIEHLTDTAGAHAEVMLRESGRLKAVT